MCQGHLAAQRKIKDTSLQWCDIDYYLCTVENVQK